MGTTTQQIEAHIEQTHEALGSNLNELEEKVRTATDWRHHFRTHPQILLAMAFGGGVVLSTVFGGRHTRSEKRVTSKPIAVADPDAESAHPEKVAARQSWNNVKGAVIAVATTRLLNYAREAFLGAPRK